jgi:hypothetical protein
VLWTGANAVAKQTSHAKSNDAASSNKPPSSHATNGHSLNHSNSRSNLLQRQGDNHKTQDSGYLAPARINALTRKESSHSDTGSAPDSSFDLYGQRSAINNMDYGERQVGNSGTFGDEEDPEHSRWIHRDKLARIESQELQAAGIILPRARAQSKSSRRENSRDHNSAGVRSEQPDQRRQRMGSFPTEEGEEPENNVWDLRLPEEAAEDQAEMYRDISGGVKGVSRIPVNKRSPLPIPIQHLERDTPIRRTRDGHSSDENELSYPKARGRSQSIKVLEDSTATPTPAKRPGVEQSPTKKGATAKKNGSQPASRVSSGQSRPKTRSSSNTTSSQRPSTRSGELGPSNSVSKRPEGDPPWLVSMYKPDPRLPPDQQLLPTVAKRLQQEQWEKEGKFGNTYDTSFRPLNDEYPRSPEPPQQTVEIVQEKPQEPIITLNTNILQNGGEWPLKGPKSPTMSTGRPSTGGAGNYSVMPKITSTPQPPLASPKPPIRMQEAPEDTKKGGCGCCVVM